jgi:REP element-mobilizing transposase RayT
MNFEKGKIYHVYNRSFEKAIIFRTPDNFRFFRRKLNALNDICEVWANCIMPNHFHLLIYISDDSNGTEPIKQLAQPSMQRISRKIGTVLSSYTQAYNKRENRKGSLFQPKTKCKELYESNYVFTCFHYIHQNPLKAKLVSKLEDCEYSSFNEYFKSIQGICTKSRTYEILDIPTDQSIFYSQSYQVINLTTSL